jgi:hypothetical protein
MPLLAKRKLSDYLGRTSRSPITPALPSSSFSLCVSSLNLSAPNGSVAFALLSTSVRRHRPRGFCLSTSSLGVINPNEFPIFHIVPLRASYYRTCNSMARSIWRLSPFLRPAHGSPQHRRRPSRHRFNGRRRYGDGPVRAVVESWTNKNSAVSRVASLSRASIQFPYLLNRKTTGTCRPERRFLATTISKRCFARQGPYDRDAREAPRLSGRSHGGCDQS